MLATDQAPESVEFNVLFVRTDLLRAKAGAIWFWATVARVRHSAAGTASRFVPLRVVSMLGMNWVLARQQITRVHSRH